MRSSRVLDPEREAAVPIGIGPEQFRAVAGFAIRRRVALGASARRRSSMPAASCPFSFDFTNRLQRIAALIERILRGENPAETRSSSPTARSPP
jgi:hypothetical protein